MGSCIKTSFRIFVSCLGVVAFIILISIFVAPRPKEQDRNPKDNEYFPFFIKTKDGQIIRDPHSPVNLVPASLNDTMATGVSTKDVIISKDPNVTVRLFKPSLIPKPQQRLPILIYFHGGGFCIGSAFERNDTIYLKKVSREGNALAVAVEYRLFPEHHLPAAYDDAMTALKWVANQNQSNGTDTDPWLVEHGDFDRIFIGGDSSGGNIAHILAMEIGKDGSLPKVLGAFLAMPYFLGISPNPDDPRNFQELSIYKIWSFVCYKCEDGEDDWHINPLGPRAPSLSGLGVRKMMVYIAEKDDLRARDYYYVNGIKASTWKGELQVFEEKGKPHVFHIQDPEDPVSTMTLIKRLSKFLND